MCIGMSLMQQDSERVCYFRVHLDDFSKKTETFRREAAKKDYSVGDGKGRATKKNFFLSLKKNLKKMWPLSLRGGATKN